MPHEQVQRSDRTLPSHARMLRLTAGLRQRDVAEAAAVSLDAVRQLERGRDVRASTLCAVARALDCRTDDLLKDRHPGAIRVSVELGDAAAEENKGI